jgi:hypothetical protein
MQGVHNPNAAADKKEEALIPKARLMNEALKP